MADRDARRGARRLYQPPTCHRTTMPISEPPANQAMLVWPNGTTMKAASSGPIAWPKLPPTWNSDWARPKRPPEAKRAMREDSGWKIAEPMPISARGEQQPS